MSRMESRLTAIALCALALCAATPALPLGTPEDFRAFIDLEYRKWGLVIAKANIRVN